MTPDQIFNSIDAGQTGSIDRAMFLRALQENDKLMTPLYTDDGDYVQSDTGRSLRDKIDVNLVMEFFLSAQQISLRKFLESSTLFREKMAPFQGKQQPTEVVTQTQAVEAVAPLVVRRASERDTRRGSRRNSRRSMSEGLLLAESRLTMTAQDIFRSLDTNDDGLINIADFEQAILVNDLLMAGDSTGSFGPKYAGTDRSGKRTASGFGGTAARAATPTSRNLRETVDVETLQEMFAKGGDISLLNFLKTCSGFQGRGSSHRSLSHAQTLAFTFDKSHGKLGFSVQERTPGPGLLVRAIERGSQVEGKLEVGDFITQVNGMDTSNLNSSDEIGKLLRVATVVREPHPLETSPSRTSRKL